MKILFVSSTYPTPTRPRQGTFNRSMIQNLRKRHEVRVIAPIPWPQRCSRSPKSDEDCGDYHPTFFYPPKVFRSRYDRYYGRSILPVIRRMETSFRPDVVLGYWLHPDGAAGQLIADQLGVPCVIVSGGSDLLRLPENPQRKLVIQSVLKRIDRLVVVSQDLARSAALLGIPSHRIDVIRRGIDRNVFHHQCPRQSRVVCSLESNSIVLLWCGRLEPVKNPTMLLTVAANLASRWGDRLKVIIAGEGSLKRSMQTRCVQLGLQNVVRFEGVLDQESLSQYYCAADRVLLTSHSEGIPNVLLESVSCGARFVATDVGGISEIADSECDVLVRANDTGAFTDAVIREIESPRLGCRRFVPDDLDRVSLRLESVLQRVIDDHRMQVAG